VELEHVVIKAMSRDPAQRYQTADELSRALADVQNALARKTNPQVSMLATAIAERGAPRRTRTKRTIDNRTLQLMGVQKKPSATQRLRGVLRKRRVRGAALGAGALLLAAAAWLGLRTREADSTPIVVEELEVASRVSSPAAAALQAPAPIAKAAAPEAAAAVQPEPAQPELAQPAPAPSPEAQHEPSATPKRSARSASSRRPSAAQRTPQPEPREAAPASAGVEDASAVSALLEKAATAFVVGDAQTAHDLYQQVTQRAPRKAEAWRGLGLASTRLGRSDEAARAYARYLELRPDARDSARIRELLDKLK
jgi:tetratricopeptide (TPR) repeat protein